MKLITAPAGADDHQGAGQVPDPGTALTRHPATLAMGALWVTTMLAALAGVALTLVARGDLAADDLFSNLAASVSVVAYATLGAIIFRRAGNVIGWIMLGEAAALAFLTVASAYSVIGVATYPGSLPAAKVVGLLAECVFPAVVFGIALMFLLFPTGRLPSRRWRPVAAAGLILVGLTTVGLVVHPRLVELPAPGGVSVTFGNPLGMAGLGPVWRTVLVGTLNGLSVVFIPFLAATLASLAVRYRVGGRLLRLQVKWLALNAVAFVVCQLIAVLGIAGGQAWLTNASYTAVQLIALFGIPAGMAIAILRHRLYDIDVIISRALVYTLLSAAVTAVYASIVLGIGTIAGQRGGPALTIAAAVSIALLFQPLRHRAQRLANRLVYGERATPYQVLADFAADMAGQLDLGEALDRMVSLLAGAAGAIRVEAWIRVGAELRPIATWPRGSALPPAIELPDAPRPLDAAQLRAALTSASALQPADALKRSDTGGRPDAAGPPDAADRPDAAGPAGRPALDGPPHAVAVRHGDDLLGALSLRKPRNEPLTPAEDKLLENVASQAGLVLRNAQLNAELRASIADLRASRRRLVEAQDAERRKIERDLHDGAQQQLVALAIQLGFLEESADDPDLIRALAPELKAAARAALDDLRDLARGIYPPLLAEQGLAGALRAQAARVHVPVQVEADGIGRYPPDTESTVYFCAMEALQNVAKHAGASLATVRVSGAKGDLEFSISDNGTGFDATRARAGSGLQGMADRLGAHGGSIEVRSQPGHGATITGRLPASALA